MMPWERKLDEWIPPGLLEGGKYASKELREAYKEKVIQKPLPKEPTPQATRSFEEMYMKAIPVVEEVFPPVASQPPEMDDLDRFARRHNSDKWAHGFTAVYSKLFDRVHTNSLLEIGVDSGASLRMWSDWFDHSVPLHGFDLKEYAPGKFGKEVSTYVCDQGNRQELYAQLMKIGGGGKWFDIVIDDGSHWQEHMQNTLGFLWQCVNPGGYYVVEDLHVCVHPDRGGSALEFQGSHMLPDEANSTLLLLEAWAQGNWAKSRYMLDGEMERIRDSAEWVKVYRPLDTNRHITCVIKKREVQV